MAANFFGYSRITEAYVNMQSVIGFKLIILKYATNSE